jgi:hypothetical protein
MLRSLIHFGLAALLVIAPALCCCTVRLLAGQLTPFPRPNPTCPACPPSEPALESCCQAGETAGRDADPKQHSKHPKPISPQHCDMCFVQPDAIPPESAPEITDPQPMGERIPIALLGLTALPIEHLGLLGGLDPPERAGVDPRFDSLFMRHVLRC